MAQQPRRSRDSHSHYSTDNHGVNTDNSHNRVNRTTENKNQIKLQIIYSSHSVDIIRKGTYITIKITWKPKNRNTKTANRAVHPFSEHLKALFEDPSYQSNVTPLIACTGHNTNNKQ